MRPCEVRGKVAGGREVRIVETTRYPFEEQIEFAFSLASPTRFPLLLRIPGWCEGARIAVNGEEDPTALPRRPASRGSTASGKRETSCCLRCR